MRVRWAFPCVSEARARPRRATEARAGRISLWGCVARAAAACSVAMLCLACARKGTNWVPGVLQDIIATAALYIGARGPVANHPDSTFAARRFVRWACTARFSTATTSGVSSGTVCRACSSPEIAPCSLVQCGDSIRRVWGGWLSPVNARPMPQLGFGVCGIMRVAIATQTRGSAGRQGCGRVGYPRGVGV